MNKFSDFWSSYVKTKVVASFFILIAILILFTIAIPAHQWSSLGWFLVEWLPIVWMVFCREHAVTEYDPDTSNYRTWNNILLISVVIYIALIGGIFGSQVIGLWQK